MSAATRVLVVLVLGVALGLFSWWSDGLPPDPTSPAAVIVILGNLPGPWLAAAFVAGAIATGAGRSAVAGVVTLAMAVGGYYAANVLSRDVAGGILLSVIGSWLPVTVVAGPVFGLAGGIWQGRAPRWSSISAGLLGGALLGESVLLVADVNPYNPFFIGMTTYLTAGLEAVAGIAASIGLARSGERGLAVALAVALAVGAALIAQLLPAAATGIWVRTVLV